LHARLGCFYVGFLRTRIEARQNLIGGDMVADVHVALDDPAAEPKRQVILDLRLDGAGQVRVTRGAKSTTLAVTASMRARGACDCPSFSLHPARRARHSRAAPAPAKDAPFRIRRTLPLPLLKALLSGVQC
jgi:hypothetical protein